MDKVTMLDCESPPSALVNVTVSAGMRHRSFEVSAGKQLSKLSDPYEPDADAAEGEWYHTWFHLVCIIAGAGTMAFPGSYAYLGWTAGIICWLIGISFAYYTSRLVAIVVHEVSARHGSRVVRYRDVCTQVWGPKAGVIAIVPWQYLNVVGISIALMIGAAQGLQGIQTTLQPDVLFTTSGKSPVPLYGFIMISSTIWWLTALIPDFHKLRFLSFVALACFVVFSSIVISLCFNHGAINNAANQQSTLDEMVFSSYGTVTGYPTLADKTFGVMNALATIAFAYGNCILPEVMGTTRDGPEKEAAKYRMFKAFNWEFALVAPYYLLVGIAGYWAFGFSTVEENFVLGQLSPATPAGGSGGGAGDYTTFYVGDGPAWTLVLANLAVFVQAIPSCQVYNQVLYDVFDPWVCKSELGVWSLWNFTMRTIVRTLYISAITFVACLLPFFGSFISLIGSLSVIPSVFVVPCLLHLTVVKPGTRNWMLYADWTIAGIALAVGLMGTISSIYSIKQAATTFALFSPIG